MNSRVFEVGSLVAFCILLVLGFYVTYYFLDVLLVAVVFSYLVRPAKEKLVFKNETLSTFLAEIVVLVPLMLFLTITFISLVNALAAEQALKEIFVGIQTIEDTMLKFTEEALTFLGVGETEIAEESVQLMTEKIQELTQSITTSIIDWAFRLPYWVARLFLAAFLSFYFVRDGKGIKTALLRIAPEQKRAKFEELFTACDAVIYGIVVGYLFKAIITGFISIFVFYILGVGNPIVMGVIVAVFDFIPLIGPWTVFLGLFLWYALQGDFTFAVQVAVTCYLTISLVPELYIRPKISGTISQVHPMVMLIGILGGVMSMGPIGVLAGPLILGMIVVTVKTYFLDIHIEREDIVDELVKTMKKKLSLSKSEKTQEKSSKEKEDSSQSRNLEGKDEQA